MDLAWHSVHLTGPPTDSISQHSNKSSKVWKKPKLHFRIAAHFWQRVRLGKIQYNIFVFLNSFRFKKRWFFIFLFYILKNEQTFCTIFSENIIKILNSKEKIHFQIEIIIKFTFTA